MNREELLKLKQQNRSNTTIYNLLSTIIGELDRIGKDLPDEKVLEVLRHLYKINNEVLALLMKGFNGIVPVDKVSTVLELQEADAFLKQFIPEALTESVINMIIYEYIANHKGCTLKEVMQHFQEFYKDRYDGEKIVPLIKAELKKYE